MPVNMCVVEEVTGLKCVICLSMQYIVALRVVRVVRVVL